MNDEIKNAIEQLKVEIDQAEVWLADAKAERGAVRKAAASGNTITMILESYHGVEWADEIGTEAIQAIYEKLVRRESLLNREIARLKTAIQEMSKNLARYELRAGDEDA